MNKLKSIQYIIISFVVSIIINMLPFSSFAGDNIDISAQENFDTDLSAWHVVSGTGFSVANKSLWFSCNTNKFSTSVIKNNAFKVENCEVSLGFNIKSGDYFSVLLRMQENNTAYYVRVYPASNNIVLFKKINNGICELIKSEHYDIKYNTNYVLHTTLIGGNIKISIEDEVLFECTDTDIQSGCIGIEANNCKVSFDNLSVFKYRDKDYTVKEDLLINPTVYIYVSPNGNDSGKGSETSPFKTIKRANQAVLGLKTKTTPVTVIFKEGEYTFTDTEIFDEKNSGTKYAPIKYKAADGEKVVFSGSAKLDVSQFKHVTDKEILSRIYEPVRDKVVQIDLNVQGISRDIVDFDQKSTQVPKITSVLLNNKRQQNARWPNTGYTEVFDAKVDSTPVIYSKNSNVSRWTKATDMYIEGYLGYDYHAAASKVSMIDADELTIKLASTPTYGVSKGKRFRAVNLLEELDIPGEWYIDKSTMTMYYYPPYELTNEDILEISILNKNLVTANGVKYIIFEGISFAKTADDKNVVNYNESGGNGIALLNCDNVTIKKCTFENIGMNGIYIDSTNIHVDGCRIYNTGFNGIFILGGDRNTLTSSGNIIENCDISNIGLDSGRNQTSAISLGSLENKNVVGVIIRNNVLHNIVNTAIMIQGNEHQIINNEIYCAVTESSDSGAIYTGRSWTNTGINISYNLFHDIGRKFSDSPYPSAAIYFDDFYTGGTIESNIIFMNNYQGTSGVMFNAATGNVLKNNTIVNSDTDIRLTGVDSSSAYFNLSDTLKNTLKEINIESEPFASRYPFTKTLKQLSENKQNWYYKNIVSDNISTGCKKSNIGEPQLREGNENYVKAPIKVENTDIYVNPKTYDFRLKNEAKLKYNIPSGILDENFDLNKIGIIGVNSLSKEDMEFNILYPSNGDNIDSQNISIVWEKANMADVYEYLIAENPDFSNVVKDSYTIYTGVTVNLECGKTYYVKVLAKNLGRTTMCSKECGVISFTTNDKRKSDPSRLIKSINNASSILSKITEGTSRGTYMIGTKSFIKEKISEALAISKMDNITQNVIDDAAYSLKKFMNRIECYENPGYATIPFKKTSSFLTYRGNPEIKVDDGKAEFTSNARTNILLDNVLSGQNVLKYRFRVSELGSYFVMAIKQKNPNVMAWSDSCYYAYITPSKIEFQNQGKVVSSISNDGLFEAGKWYEVEIGAISTVNGVNFIFKLDGHTLADYLDKENPHYENGCFSVTMPDSENMIKVELESVTDIPDKFEMSKKIKADITDTSIYMYVGGNSFENSGIWNKSDVKGYQNSDILVSNSEDASAIWTISGKNLTAYKVFYNNIKALNSGKIKVKATGTLGVYENVIDLSEREEGFTELGVFEFYAQDYGNSEIKVEIKCVDGSYVALNALKIIEADISENQLK